MSFPVPFFVYSASTGAPLAGVVATFQQYKRINGDGTITDLTSSAPAITDKGGGLYEFTVPDGQLVAGSIISYVIDATTASASRYLEDSIRSTDALPIPAVNPASITVNHIVKQNDLGAGFETLLFDPNGEMSFGPATTVAFHMRLSGGSSLVVNAAAKVVDPVAMRVRYDWAAPDVVTPGLYDAQFIVSNPVGSSGPRTFPAQGFYCIEILATF